jgi:hypothetical protein
VVESLPDVGQAGSLRGGWLPPLSGANARGTLWVGPIANRPQLTKLPHNSAPSLAYTYARSQSALLMNCVGVHFCVAHLPAGVRDVEVEQHEASSRAATVRERLELRQTHPNGRGSVWSTPTLGFSRLAGVYSHLFISMSRTLKSHTALPACGILVDVPKRD